MRFHDLRHTFGTRVAGAGVPLRTLQEWMGHRDFKTTLVYADYQPSEREAEFLERAFGPAARPSAAAAVTDQPCSLTRSTSSLRLFGQVRALPWSFIRCPPWD